MGEAQAQASPAPEMPELRERAVIAWANGCVRRSGHDSHIRRVSSDELADTRFLVALARASPLARSVILTAGSARVQRVENIAQVLKALARIGAGTVAASIQPEDWVDGRCDRAHMLSVLHALMLHTHVLPTVRAHLLPPSSDAANVRVEALRHAMLSWVKCRVAPYKGVNASDLTTSLRDGHVIAALLHAELKSFSWSATHRLASRTRVSRMLDLATHKLGVPRLLSPADVASLSSRDEPVTAAWLCYLINPSVRVMRSARRVRITSTRAVRVPVLMPAAGAAATAPATSATAPIASKGAGKRPSPKLRGRHHHHHGHHHTSHQHGTTLLVRRSPPLAKSMRHPRRTQELIRMFDRPAVSLASPAPAGKQRAVANWKRAAAVAAATASSSNADVATTSVPTTTAAAVAAATTLDASNVDAATTSATTSTPAAAAPAMTTLASATSQRPAKSSTAASKVKIAGMATTASSQRPATRRQSDKPPRAPSGKQQQQQQQDDPRRREQAERWQAARSAVMEAHAKRADGLSRSNSHSSNTSGASSDAGLVKLSDVGVAVTKRRGSDDSSASIRSAGKTRKQREGADGAEDAAAAAPRQRKRDSIDSNPVRKKLGRFLKQRPTRQELRERGIIKQTPQHRSSTSSVSEASRYSQDSAATQATAATTDTVVSTATTATTETAATSATVRTNTSGPSAASTSSSSSREPVRRVLTRFFRNRPGKEYLLRNKILQANGRVFERDLRLPAPNDVADVPYVVATLADWLRKHAVLSEGVFRLSGTRTDIMALRERFEQAGADEDVDLTGVNVHVAAGALKLYFRLLPEPLCTWDAQAAWIAVASLQARDQGARLTELAAQLPARFRATLLVMVHLLRTVIQHSDVSKMTPHNLAIVFGPTLFFERVPSGIHDQQRALVQALLLNADAVFPEASMPPLPSAMPASAVVRPSVQLPAALVSPASAPAAPLASSRSASSTTPAPGTPRLGGDAACPAQHARRHMRTVSSLDGVVAPASRTLPDAATDVRVLRQELALADRTIKQLASQAERADRLERELARLRGEFALYKQQQDIKVQQLVRADVASMASELERSQALNRHYKKLLARQGSNSSGSSSGSSVPVGASGHGKAASISSTTADRGARSSDKSLAQSDSNKSMASAMSMTSAATASSTSVASVQTDMQSTGSSTSGSSASSETMSSASQRSSRRKLTRVSSSLSRISRRMGGAFSSCSRPEPEPAAAASAPTSDQHGSLGSDARKDQAVGQHRGSQRSEKRRQQQQHDVAAEYRLRRQTSRSKPLPPTPAIQQHQDQDEPVVAPAV